MRIRNVKPAFYRSDDIDALTWEQRFMFIALFSYVDDNGVGRDRESDICADLFAGDFSVDPTETLGRVRQSLLALVRQGLVVRYEAEGKRYLFVTGWDDHQYVKNPNPVRYPRPDKALLQVSPTSGESLGRESAGVTPDLPPVVGSRSLVVGREETPTGGADAPTAQDLIAEWIDHCGTRPPARVIGQVAKEIGQMLSEGIPYADVRSGLASWQGKGLHPSTLASEVHACRTPRAPTPDRQTERKNAIFAAALERGEQQEERENIYRLELGR